MKTKTINKNEKVLTTKKEIKQALQELQKFYNIDLCKDSDNNINTLFNNQKLPNNDKITYSNIKKFVLIKMLFNKEKEYQMDYLKKCINDKLFIFPYEKNDFIQYITGYRTIDLFELDIYTSKLLSKISNNPFILKDNPNNLVKTDYNYYENFSLKEKLDYLLRQPELYLNNTNMTYINSIIDDLELIII